MTVAAIIAGLLAIMLTSGTGSEVMQRIAVPMVGGMISAMLLTLVDYTGFVFTLSWSNFVAWLVPFTC